MKKLIIVLSILIISTSIYAQNEPIIKVYDQNQEYLEVFNENNGWKIDIIRGRRVYSEWSNVNDVTRTSFLINETIRKDIVKLLKSSVDGNVFWGYQFKNYNFMVVQKKISIQLDDIWYEFDKETSDKIKNILLES